MKRLLLASLFGNVIALAAVAVVLIRPGLRHSALQTAGFEKRPISEGLPQLIIADEIAKLPQTAGTIMFAGDSQITLLPTEYYTNIRNRGIGGSTTADWRLRLPCLIESQPKSLFIEVGTNDITRGIYAWDMLDNYRQMLDAVRAGSPKTKVHIIAILPRRLEPTDRVRDINAKLGAMTREHGAEFLDFTTDFADSQGKLTADYADASGVHLNAAGKMRLIELLRPHVHD
jgi:lysophospholipase L1-like esterase